MTPMIALAQHHPVATVIWAARVCWYAYRLHAGFRL